VAAAHISRAGMDPIAFLNERDPFIRGVYQGVAAAYAKIEYDADLTRAKMIAGEIGKILQQMFGR
jgi:hypothetical protein